MGHQLPKRNDIFVITETRQVVSCSQYIVVRHIQHIVCVATSLSSRLHCSKYALMCMYILFYPEGDGPGLQPEDLEASIATLQSLAETIDAECVELRRRTEQDGVVVEYLIRQRTDERDFMEVR